MQDSQKDLEILKAWINDPEAISDSDIWRISHALAEAQYPPAKKVFVDGLNDPRWWWREDCISFLGFHYSDLDGSILHKIRILLRKDPISVVRMAAAYVLGRWSKLPDQNLFMALQYDSDLIVRQAAYKSILRLAGLNFFIIAKESDRLQKDDKVPDILEVKKVLEKHNIDLPPDYLVLSDQE